ncbi:MAG: non-homologous end-joining DNA ligase [Chitinophagales bacterium]
MSVKRTVTVGRRTLTLSNLDKLLWPEDGITKADLVRYYFTVAPYLLPHLKGRPLTVVRYPDGIAGEGFYQKNLPDSAPEWLPRCDVPSEEADPISYMMAEEPAALVWLANQGALELHPAHHRCDRLDRPDWAVVDLDPAEGATYDDVLEVAALARHILAELGLFAYPKTSGATGIHLYLPLPRRYSYQEVSRAVGYLGKLMRERNPKKVTTERLIRNRDGKVYVDHLQNLAGKTIVAAYSPRPRPGAPVSTPVTWDELFRVKPAQFSIATVPERLRRVGDLFAPVLARQQDLTAVQRWFKAAGSNARPGKTAGRSIRQ